MKRKDKLLKDGIMVFSLLLYLLIILLLFCFILNMRNKIAFSDPNVLAIQSRLSGVIWLVMTCTTGSIIVISFAELFSSKLIKKKKRIPQKKKRPKYYKRLIIIKSAFIFFMAIQVLISILVIINSRIELREESITEKNFLNQEVEKYNFSELEYMTIAIRKQYRKYQIKKSFSLVFELTFPQKKFRFYNFSKKELISEIYKKFNEKYLITVEGKRYYESYINQARVGNENLKIFLNSIYSDLEEIE